MQTYRDSNCVDPCVYELTNVVLGEPGIPVFCEFLVDDVIGIRFGECTTYVCVRYGAREGDIWLTIRLQCNLHSLYTTAHPYPTILKKGQDEDGSTVKQMRMPCGSIQDSSTSLSRRRVES